MGNFFEIYFEIFHIRDFIFLISGHLKLPWPGNLSWTRDSVVIAFSFLILI